MKIVVLGDTGMLGGMASRYFKSAGYDVVGLSRKNGFEVDGDWKYLLSHLWPVVMKDTVILNCIGAIKPVFNDKKRLSEAIYTNAVFPHKLADWTNIHLSSSNVRLIHITTDCVFSGLDGGAYNENHKHNALDEYGKSKSLGEPANCMVLRTSIIGPEWNGNNRSLVEWLVSNKGKEVNGFLNHSWNGLTTLELCKAIDKIIKRNLYSNGTFHLHSNDVTKYGMLREMAGCWNLNIKVNSVYAAEPCDRTMRTIKDLNGAVAPASFGTMIEELKEYICSR